MVNICDAVKSDQLDKLKCFSVTELNTSDSQGFTALQYSILYGKERLMEWLLEHGADPNIHTADTASALHMAVEQSNLEVILSLIMAGVRLNEPMEDDSPLHRAVNNNNSQIAILLAVCGADLNKLSQDGDAPLHCAVKSNSISMVKILLCVGADVNVKDKKGFPPIYYSAIHNKEAMTNLLFSAGAHKSDLPPFF